MIYSKGSVFQRLIESKGISLSAPVGSTSQEPPFKGTIALVIATLGVGYIPFAPGTWGSLVGVIIYLSVRALLLRLFQSYGSGNDLVFLSATGFIAIQLLVLVIVTLAGIWAASRAEAMFNEKDSGKIVIDPGASHFSHLLSRAG